MNKEAIKVGFKLEDGKFKVATCYEFKLETLGETLEKHWSSTKAAENLVNNGRIIDVTEKYLCSYKSHSPKIMGNLNTLEPREKQQNKYSFVFIDKWYAVKGKVKTGLYLEPLSTHLK